jgi:prephenate dehydrogenase
LTPTAQTDPGALAQVRVLVEMCGAHVTELSPEDHDAAVAVISHLPQAVASSLAALLSDVDPAVLALAGQGLADMTRIADSDPELWAQIAAGNARPLAATLRRLTAELSAVAESLEGAPPDAVSLEAVSSLVARGNAGRRQLPGKHGAHRQRYHVVPVVVADEPGALARLLTDAGAAGVNVEDLSMEHSPGADVGLCELLVRPDQADRLAAVLRERGWSVHQHGAAIKEAR